MAACVHFLMTDGFFSYPGFVSFEVICLSTILAVLTFLDTLSSIKCKTIGKLKANKGLKVATGVDSEEDEDEAARKRVARRKKEQDEFGDSYNDELVRSRTSYDDDTKR